MESIVNELTNSNKYGTYLIKNKFSKNYIFNVIKKYINIKNVIILENKFIIYSHCYKLNNKKYVDKLVFFFKNNNIIKIRYTKQIKKITNIKKNIIKIPSLTK